jgi:hypothetical protein
VQLIALLAVWLPLAAPARTQQPPRPSWAVTTESTAPLSLPPALRGSLAERLEYDDTAGILGVTADLNADGILDHLVRSSDRLCGTGGCVFLLVDGRTGRLLGEFLGSPLVIAGDRARGFPDIAAYRHVSATSAQYAQYRFDGQRYRRTSSRLVTGRALDSLDTALRSVPQWRPPRPAPAETTPDREPPGRQGRSDRREPRRADGTRAG